MDLGCEACKYWDTKEITKDGEWSDCLKITDDHGPKALAYAWDYEGYSAGLCVHKNFGCVLWEPR